MGADMIITITKEPKLSEEAVAWCDARSLVADDRNTLELRALLLRVEQLPVTAQDTGDWWHLLPDIDDEDDPSAVDALRGILAQAVTDLHGYRRDVTSFLIDGTWWMATGGLSWGDTPTDAYDLICLVEGFGVYEEQISPTELEAASALRAAEEAEEG